MNESLIEKQQIICPICKNNGCSFIGKPKISPMAANFIRNDYSVVQCSNCQYYFTYPVIDFSQSEWQQLYNSAYFDAMTDWHRKLRLNDISSRFTGFKNYCYNDIENFLDAGCGEGLGLIEANKRGWKAYGIDISDNRIEDAKDKNINFIHGDIFNAKFPGDFFDCIYMDSVLEHLIDPLSYLKELNRVMKKNGVLYVGVPNEDSLFNNVKKILYRLKGNPLSEKIKPFDSPYHVGGFNKISLPFAASKSKFKIAELRNFAAHFEFCKYPAGSGNFRLHLAMLPVDLLAILFGEEIYLEAYLNK
jgi:SAM-dependent methyltransferase